MTGMEGQRNNTDGIPIEEVCRITVERFPFGKVDLGEPQVRIHGQSYSTAAVSSKITKKCGVIETAALIEYIAASEAGKTIFALLFRKGKHEPESVELWLGEKFAPEKSEEGVVTPKLTEILGALPKTMQVTVIYDDDGRYNLVAKCTAKVTDAHSAIKYSPLAAAA